jgi:undecaprenyl-diphosphatase
MTYLQAVIIAIVEGITEFLPISSTGHMIITERLLGMDINEFTKAFTVNIQFGAILSVIVLYWKRFFQSLDFYFKLFVAFIPAAILGFLFSDQIDALLESVFVVALMLLLGGILFLFVDKWFINTDKKREPTYKNAFVIGLFQCIAMIPGVSRSAATIIGGMQQKLTRTKAAEFSFFLAVPTMAAASAYKLLKDYKQFNVDNIGVLLVGNLVAFVVALLAIKFFITYLQKHGFKVFGYYRIIVGAILLILLALGVDLKVV